MRLDALDQIRPDAVAALLPLAPPADPWGQNSSVDAIRALKRMRAVEYAPAVAKFLDCSVEQCVIEAIAALGDLQDQQYASPLVSLLTFSSYRVAHTAAWALARMQAKQAVPDLEQLFWHPHTMPSHIGIRYGPLTNPEKAIRARAGLALAALGVRQYAAQLSQDLITADDRELFQEIAAGLILLERKEAYVKIIAALQNRLHGDPKHLWSYPLVSGDNLLYDILLNGDLWFPGEQIMSWDDANLPNLLRVLQDDNGADSHVTDLLSAADPRIRLLGLKLLSRLSRNQNIPGLLNLLRDPDDNVHAEAVRTVARLQPHNRLGDLRGLLLDPDARTRGSAALILATFGDQASLPTIEKLLTDPMTVSDAIRSVGILHDTKYAGAFVLGLNRQSNITHPTGNPIYLPEEWDQGPTGVQHEPYEFALKQLGPVDLSVVALLLEPMYENFQMRAHRRFLSHYLGGGRPPVEAILQWIGRPKSVPSPGLLGSNEAGRAILQLTTMVPYARPCPSVLDDLTKQIARVATLGSLRENQVELLSKAAGTLDAVGSTQAAALRARIRSLDTQHYFRDAIILLGLHATFWGWLFFLYPWSPHVQALVFWNRAVRRYLGLGYVEVLILLIPAARRRLLTPFEAAFIAEALWLDSSNYFERVYVSAPKDSSRTLLRDALPRLEGRVYLEGESGLGKSLYLRRMLDQSKGARVYLRAEQCSCGVIDAIAAKAHGLAGDKQLVQALIYVGALEVYIDGLNEASVDTRAKVALFLEVYTTAKAIVTSQPIEWQPAAGVRILRILPLMEEDIRGFLASRHPAPQHGVANIAEYRQSCEEFMAEVWTSVATANELAAVREILSNPMDLDVVSGMLSEGRDPNLWSLRVQQYEIMASDYQMINLGAEFPLASFAEQVYQMRLTDSVSIPKERFIRELLCMERHRMVVRRDYGECEWLFRHDKIMDFFVSQTFLGNATDRPQRHFGDPRFRGVYLLLSRLLPIDEALNLREALIEYSADHHDHTISDEFVNMIKSRKKAMGTEYGCS
jgi:HEAT repeat protein